MTRYSAYDLEDWTARVLQRCGVDETDSRTIAALLVRSDLRGYSTHGLTRLPTYVARLADGSFNPTPHMTFDIRNALISYDADGAMGHLAGPRIVELGLSKLHEHGLVFVAVRNCGHLGALGIHALLAAESGAFCLIGQRTPPRLAMPGFRAAGIGHNPLAFACPVKDSDPIVFDAAASVAARGHILLAAAQNKAIPIGWALDSEFQPTTDPKKALEGYMLPAGGHKGLGLAMMVECLAGALTATTAAARERTRATVAGAGGGEGAFFLFLDLDALDNRGYVDAYLAAWIAEYIDAADGHARLPGRRGAELERQQRQFGLYVPAEIEEVLRRVGQELELDFDLRPISS